MYKVIILTPKEEKVNQVNNLHESCNHTNTSIYSAAFKIHSSGYEKNDIGLSSY